MHAATAEATANEDARASATGRAEENAWDTPLEPHNFLDPIGLIRHDHWRQRGFGAALQALADAPGARATVEPARRLMRFLATELDLHEADEEEDLIPLLRQRCRSDDNLDALLAQLYSDHALDADLVEFIAADLKSLAGGIGLAHPTRLALNVASFRAVHRAHTGWEEEQILPLAERRLTEDDRAALTRTMCARHRVACPGE